MSSLIAWVQDRMTKIYEFSSSHNDGGTNPSEDFNAAFDAVFASNIEITINGEEVSRDRLKEGITTSAFAATHIAVEWKDLIEVPKEATDDSDQLVTGMVAGQLTTTRSLKFRIRAAPAQNQTITVFQARIEKDPTILSDDPRRIVLFHYTTLSKPVPVHI